MTSDRHRPVPGCGKPIVTKVTATGATYPRHSTMIDGPCIGFAARTYADHELELPTGLGDAVDGATVTRLGLPSIVIVGKQVRS